MKGRIFNLLYRKTNNKEIANILANILYGILMVYYFLRRLLCFRKLDISYNEARNKVNKCSKKPEGKYDYDDRIKDENIDLSIIIPAYNVEEFIESCLNSVFNQETKYSYEVLVINDGSTDNTLKLIEKYRDKKNIKIISQNNKGFSSARNRGIDKAVGKYLMFLDSDDILGENAIEALLSTGYREDADIVQGSYYEFFDDSNKYYNYVKPEVKIPKSKNEPIGLIGFPWGKIYKWELFDKNRFSIGFWYEDTMVNYLLGRFCNKYVAIEDVVYGYRKNFKSITYTSKNSPKVLDSYWIIEEMLQLQSFMDLMVDEKTYLMTLDHLSKILYRRIHNLDKEIIKSTFILACNIIEKNKVEVNHRELIYRDLEKAFLTKNYDLWRLASFIM